MRPHINDGIAVKKELFMQTALVSLLTLAALLSLSLVLAHWTWVWLAPLPQAPAPAAMQTGLALQAAYRLFGEQAHAREPVAPTGIAIRLLGIVAATGDKEGYAVVLLEPGKILAVREGEEFAPGVRLVKVETSRLLLERAGVRETLAWPQR
jgi:general secretion pathway protein C